MSTDREQLRALVREVVREAVGGLKTPAPAPVAPPVASAARPATVAEQIGAQPTGPRAVEARKRTEAVVLRRDSEVDAFVKKLLRLFENPKTRADLRSGRLQFRLAGQPPTAAGTSHRIDSGAVTERHIVDMAGGTLSLGPRAVLTPLAREKAKSLGISIIKERQ